MTPQGITHHILLNVTNRTRAELGWLTLHSTGPTLDSLDTHYICILEWLAYSILMYPAKNYMVHKSNLYMPLRVGLPYLHDCGS